MGDQAAWFFVWIPRKEEEKRLIQVEREKQIEAARLQQEEELKVKEEARIKEEEELRAKEEEEGRLKEDGATVGTSEEKDVAPELSVVEQQKAEEVVSILQTVQSDWPPLDAVTEEAAKAEITGGGKGEPGSLASVRVIEVQEVSNPSPAPEKNSETEENLIEEDPTAVDIPISLPATPLLLNGAPATAPPTSLASGLAALTTSTTDPTPLAEKKLEQVDHEEILTLEEILNKELSNLDVSGLIWQPSRDKTTILAMFYVR